MLVKDLIDKINNNEDKDETALQDMAVSASEEPEISRRAKIIKTLVAEFNGHEALSKHFTVEGTGGKSEIDESYKYPEYLSAKRIHMANFEMEMLSRVDVESPWVVLHLHGGGYVGAMRRQYRTMAGHYSEVSGGANILSVDYRVAPEHVFPAAVDDAYAAYRWLLDEGYLPKHIVFAGDSAGGGLSMALCHRLIRLGEELPAGIVAMSPWTDLTASGPSYKDNFEKDPVFGNSRSELIYHNPYIGEADPENPEVSPAFGDFSAFPPMLIQVGTDEMLLSDSQIVAKKMREADRKVRLTEYYGMFHVFQMAGKIMEESAKAWTEVNKFFDEIKEMDA